MIAYVLSIYRREAAAEPDEPHDASPFDGIEVVGVFETDAEVQERIGHLRDQYPGARFSIDSVRSEER